MKLSIGDIIDRWTIAYLKFNRGKIDTLSEQSQYSNHCHQKNYNQKIIKDEFDNLLRINGNIWNLESDIRLGKEGELGLEEVGRRAIQIRELNKQRIEVKNRLNQVFKEGFQEVKIEHGSE